MKYVKYTYVDAVTGVPVTQEPAANGPAMPSLPGLQFDFALESEYPTDVPVMYGACTDASEGTPGLLAVLTQAECEQAKADELAARRAKAHAEAMADIADRRYRCEVAGILIDGRRVETDRTAQAMVTGAALAAVLDPAYSVRWKTADGFVTLVAEQIIGLAQSIRAHVQSCFDREAALLDALEWGSYEPDMLDSGWPGEG